MNVNCRSCRTSISRKRRGNHKQTTNMELKPLIPSVYCDTGIQKYMHTYRLQNRRFASLLSYWNAKGSTVPLAPFGKRAVEAATPRSDTPIRGTVISNQIPSLREKQTKLLAYQLVIVSKRNVYA